MLLKIHDSSSNSLMAQIELDYKYQAEEWILHTKNERGLDGKPVLWELYPGTKEVPGDIIYYWERQGKEIIGKKVEAKTNSTTYGTLYFF